MIVSVIIILILAMIVLVGYSYHQNKDTNLLKFDKIIVETELEEGFLGNQR